MEYAVNIILAFVSFITEGKETVLDLENTYVLLYLWAPIT